MNETKSLDIGSVLGSTPSANFSYGDFVRLGSLIEGAEKHLYVWEGKLSSGLWEHGRIISSLRYFTDKDIDEFYLAFRNTDDKDTSLDYLVENNKELLKLLKEKEDKIDSGKIRLFFWEPINEGKNHKFISEKGYCAETHSDCFDIGHFFYGNDSLVKRFVREETKMYRDAIRAGRDPSLNGNNEMLIEYKPEEIKPILDKI